MTNELPQRAVERMYLVDDLHVRSDGSGRIVEAYAAVFDTKTEIMDQDGHYMEELSRDSFNKTIADRGLNFGVLFNHARTVDGEPNPLATMPIGVPIEVKPDSKGLFTATRYLDNPLADHVLDGIKQGALRAQSFSGRFIRSSKERARDRGGLATIRRQEIAMREYGPAVFAAYDDAAILGTRSVELFMRALMQTPPQKRLEWLTQFEGLTTLSEPEVLDLGTPSGAATTDEPPERKPEHSTRSISVASRAKAWRITHGVGD